MFLIAKICLIFEYATEKSVCQMIKCHAGAKESLLKNKTRLCKHRRTGRVQQSQHILRA